MSEWKERMKYYIYPDGTISDELLDFKSDDFYVLQADSYEDAYEMALVMKLIWLERLLWKNYQKP